MLNALDDPTTADDTPNGFLGNGTVAYRVNVEIKTYGQWALTQINTSGHGAENPERLIFRNQDFTSTSGFYGAPGNLFTSGDLDGIRETGESNRDTSVSWDKNQVVQTSEIIYETVGRGGPYQTFVLSGLSAFNPVPEPSVLGLVGLTCGLLSLHRRRI